MDHDFWRTRWSEGRIGFHEQAGNLNLRKHWGAFLSWSHASTSKPGRVLVPLCGKTPDLTWLAAQGHSVVGIEFVQAAAQAFFHESGVDPERTEELDGPCYRYGNISILVGDFFEMSSASVGPVDLVYDRAALVAVKPNQQSQYVRRLAQWLKPGAGLFLIGFEHDIGSGPPFSLDDAPTLLSADFELERRAAGDILEAETRFRERGATRMFEVVWFARRRRWTARELPG